MNSSFVIRKSVMKQTRIEAPDYTDPRTGEVNCTALAESVCDSMNGFVNGDTPEEFFEAAFLVAEENE